MAAALNIGSPSSKKSVHDRLEPVITGPSLSAPGKSVNERLGARTAPVKQASIADYVTKSKKNKK